MGAAVPAAPLRLRGLSAAAALGLLLVLVLAFPPLTLRETVGGQAAVVGVAWLACLIVLSTRGEGAYAPSVVYLGIFGLFHCGLLIAVALSDTVATTMPLIDWLYSPYLARAASLVVIAMLAFTVATTLVPAGPPPPSTVVEPRGRTRLVAGALGLTVQISGLLMLVTAVGRVGGIPALADGYVAVLLELSGSAGFAYGSLMLGIGTVLAVVAGGRYRVIAWVVFGGYGLIAFPLGTRGSVLFPLAVLIAIEARRGRRLRLPLAAAAGVVLFTLIAAVRTTRNQGVGNLLAGDWTASPLEAVAEMGYSLRPSVVVLGWEAHGEPPRGGITFVAVLVRAVERLTGWNGGPPAVDLRLFNQEIYSRVGPIGGSPVAEGYHNFGPAGVVGVMFAIGLVVALLARRPTAFYSDALLGVVLVPLFVEIRNSFAVVIPQIGLGLALLLAIRLLAGLVATSASSTSSASATSSTSASSAVAVVPGSPGSSTSDGRAGPAGRTAAGSAP
jgi:hypothetical protein